MDRSALRLTFPPRYTNSFVWLYAWPAASTLNLAVDSGVPFARILKPGFQGLLVGWSVVFSFCVDVIDGAQQCSVLQAIIGDIDGIIHRHSCCAGFECWFFSINFLGSKTEGFGSKPAIIETEVLRVAGWLVGCLSFCVDVIDGAQQCSVLQAIIGDIDGIIHRHSCCARFECWFFSFFSCYVGCLPK